MAAMAVGCGGSVVVAAVEERDETGGGAAVVARCFNVHNDRLLVGPLVEWSFNGKGADLRQVEAVHHTGTGRILPSLLVHCNFNRNNSTPSGGTLVSLGIDPATGDASALCMTPHAAGSETGPGPCIIIPGSSSRDDADAGARVEKKNGADKANLSHNGCNPRRPCLELAPPLHTAAAAAAAAAFGKDADGYTSRRAVECRVEREVRGKGRAASGKAAAAAVSTTVLWIGRLPQLGSTAIVSTTAPVATHSAAATASMHGAQPSVGSSSSANVQWCAVALDDERDPSCPRIVKLLGEEEPEPEPEPKMPHPKRLKLQKGLGEQTEASGGGAATPSVPTPEQERRLARMAAKVKELYHVPAAYGSIATCVEVLQDCGGEGGGGGGGDPLLFVATQNCQVVVVRKGMVERCFTVPGVITKFTAAAATTKKVASTSSDRAGGYVVCGEMGPGGCYGGSVVIDGNAPSAAAAVSIHQEGWAMVVADFGGPGKPAAAALNLTECSGQWLRNLQEEDAGGGGGGSSSKGARSSGSTADAAINSTELECVLAGAQSSDGANTAAANAPAAAGGNGEAAAAEGAMRNGDPEVLEQLASALEARVVSERTGMAHLQQVEEAKRIIVQSALQRIVSATGTPSLLFADGDDDADASRTPAAAVKQQPLAELLGLNSAWGHESNGAGGSSNGSAAAAAAAGDAAVKEGTLPHLVVLDVQPNASRGTEWAVTARVKNIGNGPVALQISLVGSTAMAGTALESESFGGGIVLPGATTTIRTVASVPVDSMPVGRTATSLAAILHCRVLPEATVPPTAASAAAAAAKQAGSAMHYFHLGWFKFTNEMLLDDRNNGIALSCSSSVPLRGYSASVAVKSAHEPVQSLLERALQLLNFVPEGNDHQELCGSVWVAGMLASALLRGVVATICFEDGEENQQQGQCRGLRCTFQLYAETQQHAVAALTAIGARVPHGTTFAPSRKQAVSTALADTVESIAQIQAAFDSAKTAAGNQGANASASPAATVLNVCAAIANVPSKH